MCYGLAECREMNTDYHRFTQIFLVIIAISFCTGMLYFTSITSTQTILDIINKIRKDF